MEVYIFLRCYSLDVWSSEVSARIPFLTSRTRMALEPSRHDSALSWIDALTLAITASFRKHYSYIYHIFPYNQASVCQELRSRKLTQVHLVCTRLSTFDHPHSVQTSYERNRFKNSLHFSVFNLSWNFYTVKRGVSRHWNNFDLLPFTCLLSDYRFAVSYIF